MNLIQMMDEEAAELGLTPSDTNFESKQYSQDLFSRIYFDELEPGKSVSVSISGLEEMQNAGADRLRDLVQARVKNARLSLDAVQEPA